MLTRPELYDALRAGPFAQGALVPASPWLDDAPPAAPVVKAWKERGGVVTLALAPGVGEPPAVYGIWARRGRRWSFSTLPAGAPSVRLVPGAGGTGAITGVVVTAVDRTGNESTRVAVPLEPPAPPSTRPRGGKPAV